MQLSLALSQLGISELRSRPVPLPGGAATYLRAVFSLPPRVAIPAAIVAALLFVLPAVSVWRQRQSLRDWFALKRSARAWKIGFVGVTALLLIATTSVGAVGRNYIQHDNGFCISCHVMSSAWQRFGTSEHRSQKIADVAPQARTLKFEHRVHNRVSCTSCHTYAGGRAVVSGAGVRCAKCHDKHHAAESQCRACHKPPAKGAHTVSVHRDGCAGSGCHDPSLRLPKAPLPKTLCNACHEPGFKHKSGRRCLDCHVVKDPTAASPGEPRRNPPAIRP